VLFVADSATIQRKGFEYLAAALAGLGGRSDLFLLSVGGHAPVVSGLPLLHLGKISNDRYLSLIYSAADVFVIPSLQESFGQTVIESLACGTPVVGFNTGGIPDMVRPGITGQLAEVGNALALGDAIVRVLDDPSGHALMSRNCRAIAASEYSMTAQATAYRALYEMLIAGKSVE
jgi:glycosyltransferase involved in cell wall biosynthesis